MIPIADLIPMILAQNFRSPNLQRTPEPSAIMDGSSNVAEFDEVLDSKLAIAYAAALEWIHRTRRADSSTRAIDLACGPGHFSIYLAKYLGYQDVTGVDLSLPMIEAAQSNVDSQNVLETVRFELGDATSLRNVDDDSCGLMTFNDAAHHMPDLATVNDVLSEMDRITEPNGLIFVMDLVRLKNAALTERYVKTIGADYLARGLTSFFQDFRNSMYAAWSPEELRSAIPRDSRRRWYQVVPWGLPTIQMLVGLPIGQVRPFNRRGMPWTTDQLPVRQHLRTEWKLFRTVLYGGHCKLVYEGAEAPLLQTTR